MRVVPFAGSLWHWFRSRMGLNREHDVAIFRALDAIASESRIDEILNGRIFTSNLRPEDCHVLTDLIDALGRIENQYLDSSVRLRTEQFAWEMRQLWAWVFKTFFSMPGGWLKFRPDPIDPEVYDAEWEELNKRLESTFEAYKTYRQAIKDYLKV